MVAMATSPAFFSPFLLFIFSSYLSQELINIVVVGLKEAGGGPFFLTVRDVTSDLKDCMPL